MAKLPDLPVDDCLPELLQALSTHRRAVLQAPPGAGKSSRVPLALLPLQKTGAISGKILMLEPRRIAARATAARLAEQLGEPLGKRIGYRVRKDSVSGELIEVVTEGILTRIIQSNSELNGIGAIIFDEFHERSLHADLGLALAWDIAQILRPDLHLLVMSATLDAAPVAALLDNAPVITSQGRSFEVTHHYLERPLPKTTRLEHAMAERIETAIHNSSGGLLAFLPGEAEIRRTQAALSLPSNCQIMPLYGSMPFHKQQQVLKPLASGRKVVLATTIAQTSLTIEDIRIVVDSGLSRRARFDPHSGMSRLITERASKAEITQRAGRAGRTAKGDAYGLWSKAEMGGFLPFAPAGIEVEDLTSFTLELALWGSDDLTFLTPPPLTAIKDAKQLLQRLKALDAQGRLTQHGKAITKQPVHPRLAHMLLSAGPKAAKIAALLEARDPFYKQTIDLEASLKVLKHAAEPPPTMKRAFQAIKADGKMLAGRLSAHKNSAKLTDAQSIALAYPDRIGQRRKGKQPRYILSGGRGAVMDNGAELAQERFIVATDLDGTGRDATIRRAIRISESEIRDLFQSDIAWQEHCFWSRKDSKVLTRRQECLGTLAFHDQHWPEAPEDEIAKAMCDGIRILGGLRFKKAAARFQARAMLYRRQGGHCPDLSNDTLLDTLEDWLAPYLSGVRTAQEWKDFDCLAALTAMFTWAELQDLDSKIPEHYTTPLGGRTPISYEEDTPHISIRLQELFGVKTHPQIIGLPLKITLLSPAYKTVQVTQDLAAFWQSSYDDVRKDMRGRYPKHQWPDNPQDAQPTRTTKAKGQASNDT